MRAIPSPVDSTRPVSRTSTSRSYSWIWRLMISLISAARISIPSVPPSEAVAPARAVGAAGGGLQERPTSGNAGGQPFELRAQAAVVHGAFDVDEDAAEQRRFDVLLADDRATALARERVDHRVCLL